VNERGDEWTIKQLKRHAEKFKQENSLNRKQKGKREQHKGVYGAEMERRRTLGQTKTQTADKGFRLPTYLNRRSGFITYNPGFPPRPRSHLPPPN
jgi:hypothetical protein